MRFNPTALTLCIGLLGAASALPLAAAEPAGNARAVYQQERQNCLSGNTRQDQATCLKEAGAAQDESRRGRLQDYGVKEDNALARCDNLPDDYKADCRARTQALGTNLDNGVKETITTTQGSSVTQTHQTLPAGQEPAR